MTILILLRHLEVGGIQRLAVEQANELQRRGHDVWMVTLAQTQGTSLEEQLQIPRDHLVKLPFRRMRDFQALFRLWLLIRKIQPSTLITHQWFANTVGRIAGVCAGVPHILAFEHSTDDTRKPFKQRMVDRFLQYVSVVIAVSPWVRESLLRSGIKDKHTQVIANGITQESYMTVLRPGVHKPFCFVFIGRLIRDKGVDVLLDAFARGVSDYARLQVVGDGPEMKHLRRQATSLGLDQVVTFLGSTIDVVSVLTKSDCLVLPSRREGFGLVALEALASGIPVVASDIPSLAEFVKEEENGLLVPVGDADALAQTMVRIVCDVDLYTTCTTHARESVKQYSIQAHVNSVLSLIN